MEARIRVVMQGLTLDINIMYNWCNKSVPASLVFAIPITKLMF